MDNELQADLLQVFCSAAILKIVDDGGENWLSVPHPEIIHQDDRYYSQKTVTGWHRVRTGTVSILTKKLALAVDYVQETIKLQIKPKLPLRCVGKIQCKSTAFIFGTDGDLPQKCSVPYSS